MIFLCLDPHLMTIWQFDKSFAKMQGKEFDSELEKRPFYAKKGIVLGHVISHGRIEVDKVKIDLIAYLPCSTCMKDVR